MSLTNIKSKTQAQSGFTIVELLIVVVVIAILAAITIVSYNGITNRANASAAQSTAVTVQKKAELYASDGPTGKYPSNFTNLSTAAPSTTYYLTGVTNTAAADPTSSNGKTSISYLVCGVNASAAATSLATVTNVTGAQIRYFDFGAGTGTQSVTVGQTTGTANSYNVSCWGA